MPHGEPTHSQPHTLILGLGNILLQDDGVGVRVVEQLAERFSLPEGVAALDGGARGLALMPFLEGVRRLIVIDAVRTGAPPGTLYRLEGDEIPAFLGPKISPHQEGLADLLWAAKAVGPCPDQIVLLGVEPAAVDTGLTLSPEVAAQVAPLVEHVRRELARWGYGAEPRAQSRAAPRQSL
mgnify:CR=1 FL=1